MMDVRERIAAVVKFSCLLLLAAAALAPRPAAAWDGTGHMLVAEIARQRLTTRTLEQIGPLLSYALPPSENSLRTQDIWSASIWADDVRPLIRNQEMHYITQGFSADGTPVTTNTPKMNVTVAISDAARNLADPTAATAIRALALRNALHYVGDVHQPLHACSRWSAKNPQGDAGANAFLLPDPYQNLHAYWDSGAQLFRGEGRVPRNVAASEQSIAAMTRITQRMTAENPEEGDPLVEIMDPMAWAQESLQLAMAVAYPGAQEGAVPSKSYEALAQATAQRRITLAGYRLARLLNTALDPDAAKVLYAPKATPVVTPRPRRPETTGNNAFHSIAIDRPGRSLWDDATSAPLPEYKRVP